MNVRRRIYKAVETAARPEGDHMVLLDGRPVKTPAGHDLLAPTPEMASAVAEEWDRPRDWINPLDMPMTRHAATARDRVAPQRPQVVGDLAAYGCNDLVCYRAEYPEDLTRRQMQAWDPLLDWLRQRYDLSLAVTLGIVHRDQGERTQRAFETILGAENDITLSGLHTVTTATGSLVIALALLEGTVDASGALEAGEVDAIYQRALWGEDEEAMVRHRNLEREIAEAERLFALLGRLQRVGGRR